MATIEINTFVAARIDRCFDLARSIEFHQSSMTASTDLAVSGRTSGLISLNEHVTWYARHFGVKQHLTSKITQFDKPTHFRDEMTTGAFKSYEHDHYFKQHEFGTACLDVFRYSAPLGVIGSLAEVLFLTRYMTKLLESRALFLKNVLEGSEWKDFLVT